MAADVNADRLQLAMRMKADVVINTLTDDLAQVDSTYLLYFFARRESKLSVEIFILCRYKYILSEIENALFVSLLARNESFM
jgi:hypothetical protein